MHFSQHWGRGRRGRNNIVNRSQPDQVAVSRYRSYETLPATDCLEWEAKQGLCRLAGTSAVRVLCSNIESMTESLKGAKNELDDILFGAAQVCLL